MTRKRHKPGPAGTGTARRPAESRRSGAEGRAVQPSQPPKAVPGPQPFSAAELRQISADVTAQWFRPVEARRLTLMEIDPWSVHAYWNATEDELAAARSSLPGDGRNAALVLRFTDLSRRSADTASPHQHFDIEVQQARNNWYIGLWRDARHYSAELGLRAPNGAFAAVARSNEVVTPRAGPSPELDFRHMEVRAPRVVQVQRAARGTDQSDLLLRDLFPKRLLPEDDYPVIVADRAGFILDEPEFPHLAADSSAEEGPGDLSAVPSAAVESAGSAGDALMADRAEFPMIAAAEIEPYRAVARTAKARVMTGIGSRLPPVMEETVSPTDVDLQPQPLPLPAPVPPAAARDGQPGAEEVRGPGAEGSVAVPQPPAGTTSTWRPCIPLEAVLTGAAFSPGQGASAVEASVDVVIHGRSASESALTLFGEPVQMQGDGSFAVRLPLEHGVELAELIRRLWSRYGDKDDA